MTAGTKVIGAITNPPRYYNGVESGTSPAGEKTTRTWVGQDQYNTGKGTFLRKSYVTLDRKGRTVRRHYNARSFAEKDRRKAIPPHAYDANIVSVKYPIGYFLSRRYVESTGAFFDGANWTNTSFEGIYGSPSPTLPSWGANDDIKLIEKLKDRVRGNDFNLGVFLGEGNQTLKLIGESAQAIAKALVAARKGNFTSAIDSLAKLNAKRSLFRSPQRQKWAKSLDLKQRKLRWLEDPRLRKDPWVQDRLRIRDVAANKWLEVQYGILPLLGDVHDGAEFLAHHLNTPHRQRYEAQRTVELRLDNVAIDEYGRNYKKRYGSIRKRIVTYISEQESLPTLLGLMDPELIIWELIPFSFVVDWFIPIGSFLSARAFAQKLTGTSVTTITTTTEVSGPYYPAGGSLNGPLRTYVFLSGVGGNSAKTIVVKRTVGPISVALPEVKSLDKVASWQHCANAIALLTNLIPRGK